MIPYNFASLKGGDILPITIKSLILSGRKASNTLFRYLTPRQQLIIRETVQATWSPADRNLFGSVENKIYAAIGIFARYASPNNYHEKSRLMRYAKPLRIWPTVSKLEHFCKMIIDRTTKQPELPLSYMAPIKKRTRRIPPPKERPPSLAPYPTVISKARVGYEFDPYTRPELTDDQKSMKILASVIQYLTTTLASLRPSKDAMASIIGEASTSWNKGLIDKYASPSMRQQRIDTYCGQIQQKILAVLRPQPQQSTAITTVIGGLRTKLQDEIIQINKPSATEIDVRPTTIGRLVPEKVPSLRELMERDQYEERHKNDQREPDPTVVRLQELVSRNNAAPPATAQLLTLTPDQLQSMVRSQEQQTSDTEDDDDDNNGGVNNVDDDDDDDMMTDTPTPQPQPKVPAQPVGTEEEVDEQIGEPDESDGVYVPIDNGMQKMTLTQLKKLFNNILEEEGPDGVDSVDTLLDLINSARMQKEHLPPLATNKTGDPRDGTLRITSLYTSATGHEASAASAAAATAAPLKAAETPTPAPAPETGAPITAQPLNLEATEDKDVKDEEVKKEEEPPAPTKDQASPPPTSAQTNVQIVPGDTKGKNPVPPPAGAPTQTDAPRSAKENAASASTNGTAISPENMKDMLLTEIIGTEESERVPPPTDLFLNWVLATNRSELDDDTLSDLDEQAKSTYTLFTARLSQLTSAPLYGAYAVVVNVCTTPNTKRMAALFAPYSVLCGHPDVRANALNYPNHLDQIPQHVPSDKLLKALDEGTSISKTNTSLYDLAYLAVKDPIPPHKMMYPYPGLAITAHWLKLLGFNAENPNLLIAFMRLLQGAAPLKRGQTYGVVPTTLLTWAAGLAMRRLDVPTWTIPVIYATEPNLRRQGEVVPFQTEWRLLDNFDAFKRPFIPTDASVEQCAELLWTAASDILDIKVNTFKLMLKTDGTPKTDAKGVPLKPEPTKTPMSELLFSPTGMMRAHILVYVNEKSQSPDSQLDVPFATGQDFLNREAYSYDIHNPGAIKQVRFYPSSNKLTKKLQKTDPELALEGYGFTYAPHMLDSALSLQETSDETSLRRAIPNAQSTSISIHRPMGASPLAPAYKGARFYGYR